MDAIARFKEESGPEAPEIGMAIVARQEDGINTESVPIITDLIGRINRLRRKKDPLINLAARFVTNRII